MSCDDSVILIFVLFMKICNVLEEEGLGAEAMERCNFSFLSYLIRVRAFGGGGGGGGEAGRYSTSVWKGNFERVIVEVV